MTPHDNDATVVGNFPRSLFFPPRFDKREADLLSTLNRLEVEREEETSTLFRSASLTTTLMDLYMRSVCTEFLSTAIFPTIHR